MKPGYKQTEVGVIPEEWEVNSFSQLCVKIQDGTHFSPTIQGNDFLYITSKNIRFGYMDISTADRIDTAQHRLIFKRCDVQYGDLLLTKDGANTGNAALNILNEEFSLLSSVAFLRFDPKQHSASFFLQQCLSADGQRRMKEGMSGNAITRLTLEKIRQLQFPSPPLPEQIAIAEVLSDMDALIASTEALISKKRALKQATMQQLLTGQTRLPGFHGEWEVKRLGEVAEIDPENIGSYPPNYSFNYIALEDVTRGTLTSYTYHILSTAPSRARRKLRVGDILFATVRPNLQSHLLFVKSTDNWVCSTGFCVIRSLQKLAIPEFIYFHLFFSYVNKQIDSLLTGSNYPAVNSRDVGNLTIPLPPLPEQIAIAAVLSDMDAELDALSAQLAKTRALKQGMMQELLTGRTRLIPKPTESASHAE